MTDTPTPVSETPAPQQPQLSPLQQLFQDFASLIGLRPYYRNIEDHEKHVKLTDKLFMFFQQICQQESIQQQAQQAPVVANPVSESPAPAAEPIQPQPVSADSAAQVS